MFERALSAVVFVVVVVWGAWLHELTHAVVARALGGDVRRIDLMNLFVEFELESARRRALVFHAPAMIGLLLSPLAFAVATSDSSLLFRGAVVTSWLVYTIRGGDGELGVQRDGFYLPRLRV